MTLRLLTEIGESLANLRAQKTRTFLTALGIVFGVSASAAIGAIAGWGLHVSTQTVVLAVVFSLISGVVFGVWPARQAAKLDPIEALRYQ